MSVVVVCGRGVPEVRSPLLGLFELEQAQALSAGGLPVVYAGLDVRSLRRWRRWGLVRSVQGGVPVVALSVPLGRLPRGLNRWLMARLWDVLLAAVERDHGRPSLLHGHFLPWTAALAGRRRLRDVPLVVTEHWSRLRGALTADVRALGQAVFPRADAVVAVSQPLADAIAREFGVSAQVVPDIVDVDSFGPTAQVVREHGVRLVATGNLIARKNLDGLLRAFAVGAPADATLVVIGQGPERVGLEALAAELGIVDRVRFTGRLSRADLTTEYGRATGFALVSHAETFGVVWAEALAAGLPVLATRCGGPEDFVSAESGVLVEDLPDAIAAGMAELCAGIVEGRWVGIELSAEMVARFSAAAVVAQLREVYAGVSGS